MSSESTASTPSPSPFDLLRQLREAGEAIDFVKTPLRRGHTTPEQVETAREWAKKLRHMGKVLALGGVTQEHLNEFSVRNQPRRFALDILNFAWSPEPRSWEYLCQRLGRLLDHDEWNFTRNGQALRDI